MTDPAADAARSVAAILAPSLGPRLPADVEAAIAARDAERRPGQYLDSVSLASLIVSIAALAWTMYSDQRDRGAAGLPPEAISGQVRVTLRERNISLPAGLQDITELIAIEVIRQAGGQDQ
jgi:hypothetical protein